MGCAFGRANNPSVPPGLSNLKEKTINLKKSIKDLESISNLEKQEEEYKTNLKSLQAEQIKYKECPSYHK